MRQVSIRELQQNIRRVMERVERGETVEVTRRRRPVARLAPVRLAHGRTPWPDLDARSRRIFGTRMIAPGPGEQIIADRRSR